MVLYVFIFLLDEYILYIAVLLQIFLHYRVIKLVMKLPPYTLHQYGVLQFRLIQSK